MDGNQNGISRGSPADDFVWSFTTGAWVDTVGPVITGTKVRPDSVWKGIPVTITATVSDSSNIAISGVAYVECFLDAIGSFGNGIPIQPVDKKFDAVVEPVAVTLKTDAWFGGKHTIFIHAKDTNNKWGDLAELTVHIISESEANWAMFGQNARHTGFNAQDSTTVPLELPWSRKVFSGALNPIAVANDMIFVTPITYFDDAVIKAINANDGSERRGFSFGRIHSINPPSFAYGYVFLQTGNHTPGTYLTALDALTGKLIWQSPTASQWERHLAPTIYNGKVFINGGYYGGMYGFDAFSGQELWFKDLNQYDEWTPAVYRDLAYAFVGEQYAGGQSQLVAVDMFTGNTVWRKHDIEFSWHGWSMGTAPVIDDHTNTLFISSHEYLHAVNIDSQNVLWHKKGTFGVTPAVFAGQLFAIQSNVLTVYAIDTGAQLWSFNGDGKLQYSPAIANGYVFVSSDQNTYAVNIKTHQADWQYQAGGELTIANHHLYVAAPSGDLYAFKQLTTSVAEANSSAVPKSYALQQNYPNPFNPSTTIKYQLPKAGRVAVKIYNLNGQVVETLVDESQPAGYHTVVWKAEGLSSGIYFYRITAGDYTAVKRCVLIK